MHLRVFGHKEHKKWLKSLERGRGKTSEGEKEDVVDGGSGGDRSQVAGRALESGQEFPKIRCLRHRMLSLHHWL